MDISSNGMFQYRNTAFRVHPSLSSNENEIKSQSLSNSPHLKSENNSSKFSPNETCRTIVSMLINQRKANLSLEQQLKHLQSTNKATTSQSPPNSSLESNSNHQINQSETIKTFSLDEQQQQQRNFILQNSQRHFLTHSLSKEKYFK
jgi:hypothetical protein